MMPSVPQLLIILVIVVLIFGAKRLKNLGSDLGGAVKGFKQAVKEDEDGTDKDPARLEDERAGTERTATERAAAEPAPAPAESAVVRKTDDQNAA